MPTPPTDSDLRTRSRALPLYPRGWAGAVLVVLALALLFMLLDRDAQAQAESPAGTLRNDADRDGVVDTADVDDDNDGVLDRLEIAADGSDRDSDSDGMPDRLDLDSDNDGLLDWQESGAVFSIDLSGLSTRGGRLVGPVGENGMLDVLEAPVDSGRARFELANSDSPFDTLVDMLDLDADNDGLADLVEAGVPPFRDADRDGRIDAPIGSVGADGIADYLQPINDESCCDVTGDGRPDILPLNSDAAGLPDPLDLDSDDDGVSDLVEAGGTDVDGDARVDGFVDVQGTPDGFDDAYRAAPLLGTDLNGNGLIDHRDAAIVGSVEPGEEPRAGDVDQGGSGEPEVLGTPGLTQIYRDDDGSDPAVLTGLNASGCSIGASGARANMLWVAVLLVSAAALWLRRRPPRALRRVWSRSSSRE